MDASQLASPIRRQTRVRRKLLLVLVCLFVAFTTWFRGKTEADPADVQSGPYQFVQINADTSLRFLISNTKPNQIDVRWLAVEITDAEQVIDWIESEIRPFESVQIRLDRRRLDEHGSLAAYFFKDDRLLNAELVRQGLAREATHPSDFAPIARQIRRAANGELATK